MCNHDCNQGRNCDCNPQMEVCPTGTLAELARLREQLAEREVYGEQKRKEGMEEAARICNEYAGDKWDAYKGRGEHDKNNPCRGDDYTQGQSDGASDCAEAIRAAIEQESKP